MVLDVVDVGLEVVELLEGELDDDDDGHGLSSGQCVCTTVCTTGPSRWRNAPPYALTWSKGSRSMAAADRCIVSVIKGDGRYQVLLVKSLGGRWKAVEENRVLRHQTSTLPSVERVSNGRLHTKGTPTHRWIRTVGQRPGVPTKCAFQSESGRSEARVDVSRYSDALSSCNKFKP